VDIYAKNVKYGYLNPIFGKLGVTHDIGWWLVGKPVVDFLFALIELLSLSVMVLELWGGLAVFTRGRRPFTQILPRQGRPPSTILGIRKLETLRYPKVKTASLCIPSGDGQTDGRTDMP